MYHPYGRGMSCPFMTISAWNQKCHVGIHLLCHIAYQVILSVVLLEEGWYTLSDLDIFRSIYSFNIKLSCCFFQVLIMFTTQPLSCNHTLCDPWHQAIKHICKYTYVYAHIYMQVLSCPTCKTFSASDILIWRKNMFITQSFKVSGTLCGILCMWRHSTLMWFQMIIAINLGYYMWASEAGS